MSELLCSSTTTGAESQFLISMTLCANLRSSGVTVFERLHRCDAKKCDMFPFNGLGTVGRSHTHCGEEPEREGLKRCLDEDIFL